MNASHKKTNAYVVELDNPQRIQASRKRTADLLKHYWQHYSELARQRSAIQDQIQQALIQTAIPYEISRWQRAVKYKYGLHPLSTVGSLSFIGGRFNTGKGVNSEVPFFPGLYLAQNKDTALQEHLGQIPNEHLTPREIALTNPSSETIVSVSGKLDKVLDLTHQDSLIPFINLIKNFKFSKELKASTKKLKLQDAKIIKTPEALLKNFLDPNWRVSPSQYDIPANSQILGHLVYSAGIEGILYPSKFTGQLCLVVYPKNFVNTDSFVVLDDEAPHEKVPIKIDGYNWRLTDLEASEIMMPA